jgi:hypothetical protein
MSKNIVYEIHVFGWEKHNKRVKKGFEYFMLSNRFFDDHKIATLTSLERLLYVAILARCADERAATTRPTRDQLLTMLGQRRYDLATALNRLQENQLLSYQKIAPLIQVNRSEVKRSEDKTSEVNNLRIGSLAPASKKQKPDPVEKELNRQIWQSYFDAYRLRYGVDPVRNGRINGQIGQLGKRLGKDAIEVVKFYLRHSDGFYLKNCHSLGLCLKDAESLHSQWQRGIQVTNSKIKQYEKQNSIQETIDLLSQREV